MTTITGLVEEVKKDQTKAGKDIYKVKIDGKVYTTFDRPVAEQAFAFKGQKATAQVEVKQTGEYTNYNLRGVSALAEIPSVAGEKDQQIARAVALKAAVDFQAGKGSIADVKLAADEFLAWLNGTGPVKAADVTVPDEADDIPF